MAIPTNLGYPRIGPARELKKTLERYWAGKMAAEELAERGREIRRLNWEQQRDAGIAHIPSNDFSFYDHVLDTAAMVGAVPSRYEWDGSLVDFPLYFAMARGLEAAGEGEGWGVPAMEMTKWFDTNYHYIVPEFEEGQTFRPASAKPVEEFLEAAALGIHTRPVLLGPVSFLMLGKAKSADLDPLSLLDGLLPVYGEVLERLGRAGADWVQIDEPCLALDLTQREQRAFRHAYDRLSRHAGSLEILVATYFGGLRENLDAALGLPVAAVHLDVVRAPEALGAALGRTPDSLSLSLGVVDGRNVWRSDLDRALALINRAVEALGSDRVLIGPSCSLLHSPLDLELETALDAELRGWLAFARQKVREIAVLSKALNDGSDAVKEELASSRVALAARRSSARIHVPAVRERVARAGGDRPRRPSPHLERRTVQRRRLRLPLFPITTIGSFPQTAELRSARARRRSGKISEAALKEQLRDRIEEAIRFQEEVGLDVLVHGEFERADMVEYFGHRLTGFAGTGHGWIQSYGSRCVKPPIIYGDVERKEPMTVAWWRLAQSMTDRPVKGMLTGPVTLLQWSLVRDDQPREETCRQIALAIGDEARDLEAAGAAIIQIDEPAIREGLPLRRSDWKAYLGWAVDCFRLASSGVRDDTQIQTHMCYSEFNDIIESIADMDADVLFIESSRSQMELLDAFVRYRYPNEIGPGIWDIHSPRIPSVEEMEALLGKALKVLAAEQLWVNPDCGLKTRRWEEVRPALAAMVQAARNLRCKIHPSH